MNEQSEKPTPEFYLNELAELLLDGGEVTLVFVEQLGTAYEETTSWPSGWVSHVILYGVAARASRELMRWLILKEFEDRSVKYDIGEVNAFIDGLYAQRKTAFDEDPKFYISRHC